MSRQSDKPEVGRGKSMAEGTQSSSPPGDESARVRVVPGGKPRHGKKRRASQKRHEVGVVRELHLHPNETPEQAARAVRRAPAQVIDVTDDLRARAARSMPNSAPETPGLVGMVERFRDDGREMLLHGLERVFDVVGKIVTFPAEARRALRAFRHREA